MFMPCTNNKGADQRSDSAFVVRCLDSIIHIIAKIGPLSDKRDLTTLCSAQ